jgi:adenylate kinase family enzyme
MRIILLGNAGAGKSTMARRLIGTKNIPRLSLDEIAWEQAAERVRTPKAAIRIDADSLLQTSLRIVLRKDLNFSGR